MDYTFVSIHLHFAYEQEVPSKKLKLPKNNKININLVEKYINKCMNLQ